MTKHLPMSPRAVPQLDDWGGGRGPFEVDSFHAMPIGIMLNSEKFAGDQSPPPIPLVLLPMYVSADQDTNKQQKRVTECHNARGFRHEGLIGGDGCIGT